MPWQINYGGATYRESDLTIGQCEELEELIGLSWLSLNPLRSAKHARILTAYLVSQGTGRPFAEVSAEVATLKVETFLDGFENAPRVVEEERDDMPAEWTDGIPLKGAVPSTGTS